jgi:hypothetical protein
MSNPKLIALVKTAFWKTTVAVGYLVLAVIGWDGRARVCLGDAQRARHLRRRAGFCAGQARSLDTSFNHGDRKVVAPIRRQSES